MAYQAWLAQQRRLAAQQKQMAEQAAALVKLIKLGMAPLRNALQYLAGIPARAQAQAFIYQYFNQDLSLTDFNNLSRSQRKEFFDSLSEFIVPLVPDLTVDSPSFTTLIGNNTRIYYQVSTTADINNSNIGNINLALQDQKLLFENFSSQIGPYRLKFRGTVNGEAVFGFTNSFENNTANLELKYDATQHKVNAEFSISSDLDNNISINSTIGLELKHSSKGNSAKSESKSGWEKFENGFYSFGRGVNSFMNGLFGDSNNEVSPFGIPTIPFWQWVFT